MTGLKERIQEMRILTQIEQEKCPLMRLFLTQRRRRRTDQTGNLLLKQERVRAVLPTRRTQLRITNGIKAV